MRLCSQKVRKYKGEQEPWDRLNGKLRPRKWAFYTIYEKYFPFVNGKFIFLISRATRPVLPKRMQSRLNECFQAKESISCLRVRIHMITRCQDINKIVRNDFVNVSRAYMRRLYY